MLDVPAIGPQPNPTPPPKPEAAAEPEVDNSVRADLAALTQRFLEMSQNRKPQDLPSLDLKPSEAAILALAGALSPTVRENVIAPLLQQRQERPLQQLALDQQFQQQQFADLGRLANILIPQAQLEQQDKGFKLQQQALEQKQAKLEQEAAQKQARFEAMAFGLQQDVDQMESFAQTYEAFGDQGRANLLRSEARAAQTSILSGDAEDVEKRRARLGSVADRELRHIGQIQAEIRAQARLDGADPPEDFKTAAILSVLPEIGHLENLMKDNPDVGGPFAGKLVSLTGTQAFQSEAWHKKESSMTVIAAFMRNILSGAAVSVQEWEFLKGLIPTMEKSDAQIAIELQTLKRFLNSMAGLMSKRKEAAAPLIARYEATHGPINPDDPEDLAFLQSVADQVHSQFEPLVLPPKDSTAFGVVNDSAIEAPTGTGPAEPELSALEQLGEGIFFPRQPRRERAPRPENRNPFRRGATGRGIAAVFGNLLSGNEEKSP